MLKKFSKDVAIYGLSDFIFKAISFSIFPVYTHEFNVAEYGLMSLLVVMSGLIGMFFNAGVNNSVQRYYWDSKTGKIEQPLIVSAGLIQLMLFGAVVIVLLICLAFIYKNELFIKFKVSWILFLICFSTIFFDQIIQYCLDAIRLRFAPINFLILSFLKNLFGVMFGLLLIIKMHRGIFGYFEGALIASLISAPIAVWFIRKDLVAKYDKKIAIAIFRYGYPFIFTGLAYWVFGYMDRWMLERMSSMYQVGLYSIAFKISSVIMFVQGAFGLAWSPFSIKLISDTPNYRQIYSKILTLWFFVLALLGYIVSVFSNEVLIALTPKEYWDSSISVGIIAIGLVFFGTTQVTALGMSIEKKTHLLTYAAWITAVTNFLLNLLLIPLYGAEGSAIATLVSYVILTSYYLWYTQILHPIPLEINKLLYCVFIICISLVVPHIFIQPQIIPIAIFIKISIFTLILVGAFYCNIIEKNIFLKLMKIK